MGDSGSAEEPTHIDLGCDCRGVDTCNDDEASNGCQARNLCVVVMPSLAKRSVLVYTLTTCERGAGGGSQSLARDPAQRVPLLADHFPC